MRLTITVILCLGALVHPVLTEQHHNATSQLIEPGSSRILSRQQRKALLFPIQTTLQVSMLTATDGRLFAPPKKYPARKLGINLGFQQNFNLPFRLLEFYKPPTWARALVGVLRGDFPSTSVVRARSFRRSIAQQQPPHQPLALTAGQLYTHAEDLLHVFGYDTDCLLRSVCELAHSPFDRSPGENEDMMTEVVHLLLSPSVHQSFADDEAELRRKYEMAERLGASGANCELIYERCHRSVLSDFSNLIDVS
ncbi:uncharacterized protein LOC126569262 [Anopheles aquasalis]|uniref:uncharacterized protein LOC126569262 n=1 Tax=Anopheles aquasalis TaxID=42839 RepID=UPI00215AB848|nr:uncharacterized protein LOC126569262 [Anopheles aquasalis]